jgi:hypothetical protein
VQFEYFINILHVLNIITTSLLMKYVKQTFQTHTATHILDNAAQETMPDDKQSAPYF